MAKTLNELLKALPPDVKSVTSDSRQVKPGTLFVAVRGGAHDGHRFFDDAVKAGAVFLVGEEAPRAFPVPYLRVSDSREALAGIAAAFFDHPSHGLVTVGVTGTSGKTTTTYLIESILKSAGHKVGVIGTVNFRFGAKIYPSTHTTPGPLELQGLLERMKADGCTAVVMEVSSHALKQRRAAFTAFDAVAFTNLSREHLDFHPDMEDYFGSKALLFTEALDYSRSVGKKPVAAVNEDDEYGQRLIGILRGESKTPIRAYSAAKAGLSLDFIGIHGRVDGVDIESELVGSFNAANILAALQVALGLGIAPGAIARGIRELAIVPGRLQRVPNSRGIHVLVDYAHKPDALEKVLRIFQDSRQDSRSSHRVITVFGCGGDRDRTKRPVMGKIAVELSDQVVITSDNPRTENPDAIIREILEGTRGHKNFTVQPDRRKAIHEAIARARPGDLVLIAGKGHEDYQIIADPAAPGGTRKIHFDDCEVAGEALTS